MGVDAANVLSLDTLHQLCTASGMLCLYQALMSFIECVFLTWLLKLGYVQLVVVGRIHARWWVVC